MPNKIQYDKLVNWRNELKITKGHFTETNEILHLGKRNHRFRMGFACFKIVDDDQLNVNKSHFTHHLHNYSFQITGSNNLTMFYVG